MFYGEPHSRYTIERAMIYNPEMLAEGYENDAWRLIYSFADYDDAVEYMRADSVEWGKIAKHQLRDATTGKVIARAEYCRWAKSILSFPRGE